VVSGERRKRNNNLVIPGPPRTHCSGLRRQDAEANAEGHPKGEPRDAVSNPESAFRET